MQEMTVQVFVRTQLFYIRQRRPFELFGTEYVCFIIIENVTKIREWDAWDREILSTILLKIASHFLGDFEK